MNKLAGKKIAILVDDLFEEDEFTGPLNDLKRAGAEVDIVAPKAGQIQALKHAEKARRFEANKSLDDIRLEDYDALVMPGGAMNADSLRMNLMARKGIKKFMDMGKPVAAICHAPWALISAGVAKGRKMTSYETIQDDVRNAGAVWVDQEVVIDGNLITSRKPDDIPAFDKALIKMLQTA